MAPSIRRRSLGSSSAKWVPSRPPRWCGPTRSWCSMEVSGVAPGWGGRGAPPARGAPAAPGRCAWSARRSEGGQRRVARVRDVEEGVELGELEERAQVLVQVGQAQLAALLADLLGEADQHAQPRGVDVAGVGEVDQELPLTALELVEHLLLQLLAVAHDELPVHVHHHHPVLLARSEAHGSSGPFAGLTAVPASGASRGNNRAICRPTRALTAEATRVRPPAQTP